MLDALRILLDPFAFAEPAQRAVAAVLASPAAALASVATIRRQRDVLATMLGRLPGAYVFPSETNFLLVRIDPPVAFSGADAWIAQSAIPGALRVAIGTPEDDARALALLTRLTTVA